MTSEVMNTVKICKGKKRSLNKVCVGSNLDLFNIFFSKLLHKVEVGTINVSREERRNS